MIGFHNPLLVRAFLRHRPYSSWKIQASSKLAQSPYAEQVIEPVNLDGREGLSPSDGEEGDLLASNPNAGSLIS